ncbi:hypothetical protein OHA45_05515 [Streptomyces lydicus]|uniref:hypothetical protein n=1 Tax=Streptomyces lydicus TaxID=47763 RepID=UPI002E32AC75|nr:hypothetical protein [Streptomyces lydicus]
MRHTSTATTLITVGCLGLLTACTEGNDQAKPEPTPRTALSLRQGAANGHTVKVGNSKGAARIAPIGFHDGGSTVQPHTFRRNTIAFDITSSEKGGTLVYVDGNGDAFRWKIPAASSGDAASALKSALT